jgi:nicotinic acid phosphoribosyltransferase
MAARPLDENISIDLDALEYDTHEKFTFKLAGRVIELGDPNLVDWKILAAMEQPIELLKHVTKSDEDRAWIRNHPLPIEGLHRLMDKYAAHFKLPELGKGAGSVI